MATFNCGMNDTDKEMIIPNFVFEEDLKNKRNVSGFRRMQYIMYTLAALCFGLLLIGFILGITKYHQITIEIKKLDSDVSLFKSQDSPESKLSKLESQLKTQNSEISVKLQTVQLDLSHLKLQDSQLALKQSSMELEQFKQVSQISSDVQRNKNDLSLLKNNVSQSTTSILNDLSSLKTKVCDEKPCPCDWNIFRHYCYYFSKGQRTWEEAKQYCISQDSQLAMIKTMDELKFIGSKISLRSWVGLNDLQTEREWRWLDGSPASLSHEYWNPGEPNNEGEEDCGEIKNGKLNDIPCNLSQQWICQKVA